MCPKVWGSHCTWAAVTAALLCAAGASPSLGIECTINEDCISRETNSFCDIEHSLCVCTKGLYREPPYKNIKCSEGKVYNEECRTHKQCFIVDHYSDCMRGLCKCQPGYNPIPLNRTKMVRCMLDPFYINAEHAHLTFFKVSPVPLLVICIILVYLGYQRGAKVPQRRGSSTSNRRIVPMWRGVTFHQGASPPRNSTSLSPPNSHAAPNAITVNIPELGLRRESTNADSRRGRDQRDSHEREGRVVRDTAMSPPPPYAQEEAPPSYEDAIRASRVAMVGVGAVPQPQQLQQQQQTDSIIVNEIREGGK